MKQVVVVGAGMGGIATAGRLARRGFEVTVVEARSKPGGRCDRLQANGFRFDMGPTLFLMPAVYEETFADLGEQLRDHLDLHQIQPTYRVHFHDGTQLDLAADLVSMREQLEAMEAGSFEQYLRFVASGCRFYRVSLDRFVMRNFYSLFDMFNPLNIGLVFQLKALTTHFRHTSGFFSDSRLRAAFSFQNMYLGLSPYEAPATYALLQYSELADGVWFPRGGMYRAIEELVKIAEGLGVRFLYNSPVRQIELDGAKASGVLLEHGEKVAADLVVVNADLPYAYQNLLPDDGTARALARKRYSSSTLMFYWNVKGPRSPHLMHHNVFLADHCYRESFDQIFHEKTLPSEPSFYVCAPTRTDASFAPPDGDSLMVLVPVGHIRDDTPQNWPALRDRARKAVLDRLAAVGIRNLDSAIARENTLGPEDYLREYHLAKGAAFGLSHNFMQTGFLRPHNRHRRYGNLYFVGASTHPGTGLPIVLLSARLVVERILREHGLPKATVAAGAFSPRAIPA
ncbi:MAG: phytoene desaturase family protein [Candidatus Sumerlaeia bacterium]|nr:phytoene desaturase family protein [Candidatus Sumerlaeia bacterium]